MSEFELTQLISGATESLKSDAMNFVTLVFAYVIAAHLAGAKLPRKVAVLLSATYSLFQLAPAGGVIFDARRSIAFAERLFAEFPDSPLPRPSFGFAFIVLLAVGPLLLGWLGSLYYMHGIVRSKSSA